MPSWVHTAELLRFDVEPPARDGASADRTPWRCMRPSADGWPAIAAGLRKAGAVLREMPIAEIVAALDLVAERWGDRSWPFRIAARDEIARATGFSLEAIDRSLDVELRNYRAESLWAALRRELGDPALLDGFRPDPLLPGATHAIGPDIALAIFTGNVPGLPALALIRALLVKSAVIAKVASGEPTFASLFVRSIFEIEPRLADAIVVTYWDREDRGTLDTVLDCTQAVIAYGSGEACAAIAAAVSPDHRLALHGHKLSFGLISDRYLAEQGFERLSQRIAVDVCTFNQHACIAPQVYFLEGTGEVARELGRQVAQALEAYRRECPLGELGVHDAAGLQLRRASQAWRASSGAPLDLWEGPGLEWTVAVDSDLSADAGGGNRFIRLIPVRELSAALDQIRPYARYLQNVGLGATAAELPALARDLAQLGATRISEPGRMAEPSMMWRHDGRLCIAELLRWCDVEMHADATAFEGGGEEPS